MADVTEILTASHTKKISFLVADEMQTTETSVGQHACWILAFFLVKTKEL